MCNIWVILRRNVRYLYSKKPHLDQLFHCHVIRCHLVNFWYKKNKGKVICNSPNDIISANFDSEKVDQDGIFIIKIYYISSSNDPKNTHNHIWGQTHFKKHVLANIRQNYVNHKCIIIFQVSNPLRIGSFAKFKDEIKRSCRPRPGSAWCTGKREILVGKLIQILQYNVLSKIVHHFGWQKSFIQPTSV